MHSICIQITPIFLTVLSNCNFDQSVTRCSGQLISLLLPVADRQHGALTTELTTAPRSLPIGNTVQLPLNCYTGRSVCRSSTPCIRRQISRQLLVSACVILSSFMSSMHIFMRPTYFISFDLILLGCTPSSSNKR